MLSFCYHSYEIWLSVILYAGCCRCLLAVCRFFFQERVIVLLLYYTIAAASAASEVIVLSTTHGAAQHTELFYSLLAAFVAACSLELHILLLLVNSSSLLRRDYPRQWVTLTSRMVVLVVLLTPRIQSRLLVRLFLLIAIQSCPK